MCSTENSSESLNHDTRGSFSFSSPTCVPGLKRPATYAFLFSVLKFYLLNVTMEKTRGDASCVVLLVPPVLPSEDLAERVFLH